MQQNYYPSKSRKNKTTNLNFNKHFYHKPMLIINRTSLKIDKILIIKQ